MTNAKKIVGRIVGIILLVIGLLIIFWGGLAMVNLFINYGGWWVLGLFGFIFGVILSLIGVCILISSKKKNSKSLDKSITK